MTGPLADLALHRLLGVLSEGGETALIVGGAVRNALLQRPVNDIDIATTLAPEAVIARAKKAGFKPVPTGIAHGTVTVVANGRPFEVTTLRQDIETDGRHATVRFGRDVAEDARRRDFTINALYADATGAILDPVGGLADIALRRVRFIGDPRLRIREDYLRILRFFRFSADYGEGAFDEAALEAIDHERAGLETLSRERVRAESLKLLAARRAPLALRLMDRLGLLEDLFGCPADPDTVERLLAFAPDANALTRLAALCLRSLPQATILRDRLRLSNAEASRLDALGRALEALAVRDGPVEENDAARLAFALGRRAAREALQIEAARRGLEPDQEAILAAEQAPTASPFTGERLLKAGLSPGKRMGAIIRHADRRWADAGFPAGSGAIAAILEQAIAATEETFES